MPTRTTDSIELPETSPGTARRIKTIRYGDAGGRPKAYLQTGLHADEIPGMLVMQYLDRLLFEADIQGRISGEVILVPVANPLGLSQYFHGYLSGRHEIGGGQNFNRGYPDVTDAVAKAVASDLSQDEAANVALIRRAISAAIDEYPAADELSAMRKALMKLSADADICLDLHCDWEAILHLYLGTPLWPDASDLAAQLGSSVTLLAEVSGGNPFDEVAGGIWWALARRFPGVPIPAACLSGTVELRGSRDISRASAKLDAENLFRFLMRRGLVEGDPGALPELPEPATPLEGVDMVVAPHAGVVVYLRRPGDRVKAGEAVAEIIDPLADPTDDNTTTLYARVSGIIYSHRLDRFARPGKFLLRIAGDTPLADRLGGHLLSD